MIGSGKVTYYFSTCLNVYASGPREKVKVILEVALITTIVWLIKVASIFLELLLEELKGKIGKIGNSA